MAHGARPADRGARVRRRQIAFSTQKIAAVEKLIAQQALASVEIRRLMSVPGVNPICAATFIAAVGDPNRFSTSRKLVAYLGLDPTVCSPAKGPADGLDLQTPARPRAGRWSKPPGCLRAPSPCFPVA